MIKSLVCPLIFFVSLVYVLPVNAQTIFEGTVYDAETGETIPAISIYISGATIGTTTDANGRYSLKSSLTGKVELVASGISHDPESEILISGTEGIQEQDFYLTPRLIELGEIEIVVSNAEFKRQLEHFKEFFLGYDPYAKKTSMENFEVLSFNWSDSLQQYMVTTEQPLIIKNDALGYVYEVEFADVHFDPITKAGFYRVYPRVIEMETDSRRQQRRWNRNRRNAYLPSSRRFFKALVDGMLEEDKFEVYPHGSLVEVNGFMTLRQLYPENWRFIMNNYKIYQIKSPDFQVSYGLKNNEAQSDRLEKNTSSINLIGPGKLLIVNEDGFLYNPEHVQFVGKWNNDRFSRFLPRDYEE